MIKKIILVTLVIASFGFSAHKFYVGIFQFNYAPEKKMLQITSRIFVDDLNEAFKMRYHRSFAFEDPKVSAEDMALLQKYFKEKFAISVNEKPYQAMLLSCEMESNVLICYLSIRNISKVKSLQIRNEILTDYVTEQQNIIQTTVNGNKKSLLLTSDKPSGKLIYN